MNRQRSKNMTVKFKNNYKFTDSLLLNDETYYDYLLRFKRVALSMFEWVNLPSSMNADWLEYCLYYMGEATLLFDKEFGFINTNCSSNGVVNIYGLPTGFHCYSFGYSADRTLYTGQLPNLSEKQKENMKDKYCILVKNNWDRTPTAGSMELFAYRLYEAQRTADVNIIAQKTPVMIVVDEKQRAMMINLYNQYNGNQPFIFGDKKQLSKDMLQAIKTDAPFIADKVMDYKKEIWNESLTFLRHK